MATSTIRNLPSIVEQGTEGTWYYRKYSDGKAECWGYRNLHSLSITTQYGSAYYGTKVTVNFPTDLFATPPTPTIMLNSASGTWAGVEDWDKTNYRYYPFAPKSVTVNAYETCYAVGRWK